MFHLLLAVIYLSFISLGLPDGLLGAAWPTIYPQFDVPVSYAGIVSTIIAAGTVVSSLMSDRLTLKLGTGKITALSVLMTALALLGFSLSDSFWQLCLWAIPYGLGAGSVDASINNYVALHYPSRHMSWLHCMWGVGAATGPYVMGFVLAGGQDWHNGYLYIGLFQILLTAILLFSLPLWKKRTPDTGSADPDSEVKPLALSDVIKIPGAKEVMITFFCYCALESTAGLWASSYLALHRGIPAETAAFFASLFYLGITAGRALNGFLTLKFNDTQLIRLGIVVIAMGIAALLLPGPRFLALAGLIIIGFGCAPIYPCVIHSTPEHFGADKSQALIGVQMASAYVGTCVMPPLFGLIANHITVALLPVYLLIILILMFVMHERLIRQCEN
ncbi:MAG: MFS transporter [Lachnospiraceae bacterium]|nr:MFS transporter [Lachnospiraceae bacterium]